jgi:dTDP-glucose 4,6-dehydratase
MALQESPAEIVNVDKLSYAGNLQNLVSVADHPRYRFHKIDICDLDALRQVFEETKPDAVVHFAAESHVDRSIFSPQPVFETNLRGTFNLLECMRAKPVSRFIHVSTDEVYGSLEAPLEADENFPLQPSSPYSAAKAGSDLLALGYFKTYKLPVIVTRASNNYGPYQFPEKLIPLMISNAMEDKPLPVYGDGLQVRDWLYVEDHCRALFAILEKGRDGEIYNIGSDRETPIEELAYQVIRHLHSKSSVRRIPYEIAYEQGFEDMLRRVPALEKIKSLIGWQPVTPLDTCIDLVARHFEQKAALAQVKQQPLRASGLAAGS